MEPIRIAYQSYTDEAQAGSYWDNLREYLAGVVDEGTTVDILGITPPDSYAHALSEFRCAREVICNAVIAEREGYDVFAMGHFQDAGLYEARAVVDIPVLSLGEVSMLHACQLGQKIGIVTINPRYISWFHHQIGKYGLRERVTGVHAMSFEPGAILAGFDDPVRFDETVASFAAQGAPLVEGGIDALIPGGGIAMLLFARIFDHNIGGAPVINGIPILVKAAEMAVKLKRLTGLSASRAGEFEKPPPEVIDEFMTNPKGL